MTNEEILQKAIEKAIKNGFNNRSWRIEAAELHKCYESLIFSHAFAKAFWGEEDVDEPTNEYVAGKKIIETHGIAWKYHLRQMVLEENPLKYLEKFI